MKDKRPFIIFGITALLLLIFFIFLQKNGRRFNWRETYTETSQEPYGTYITHQLLQNYFPGQAFSDMEESIAETFNDSTIGGNYVFIGEALYLDTTSLDQLLTFVGRGGNAFISSKTVPYDLMEYLYPEPCNETQWEDYYFRSDTIVSLNVFHRDLADSLGYDYKYIYYGDVQEYQWHFIDSIFFCDENYSMVELGGIDDGYINFAKIPYAGGSFYLHTNPIAFTNIQMLDELGLAYSSRVFSHLEEGPIYWDAFSRTEEAVGRRYNQMAGHGERDPAEGPLKYVLSQPSLTWAWYLLLALGLLYLFFHAKRKQRIIPVLEENSNTSLAFISTIGRLYFLQNDHRKLSLQKIRLFRNFIRERYNLAISPEDESFIPKLVARSEVPDAVVEKIALMSRNIKGSSFVSEKTMVEFHQVLDMFYKNCK